MTNRYDTTAATVNRVERRIPRFEPTIAANVGVVVLQSLAVACASLGVFAGVFAFGMTGRVAWMLLTVWAASFGLAFAWRARVVEGGQVAVETIETPAQVAPMLDMPALPAPEIVLLNPHEGRAQLAAETRTALKARFADFVWGCVHDTTAGRWDAELGRATYRKWRDLLLSSGWARLNGPTLRQGWTLTAEPQRIVDAIEDGEL